MNEFKTTMYQVDRMIKNREKLLSMGLKVSVSSEMISVIKAAPEKDKQDWWLYQNFESLSQFNLFCDLLFELVCTDSNNSLDDLIEHLRDMKIKRYEEE